MPWFTVKSWWGDQTLQSGGDDDGQFRAEKPKDTDPVICGAKGAPTCGSRGQLTETDKMVIDDAGQMRRATAADGLERGRSIYREDGQLEFGDVQKGTKEAVDIPNPPKGTTALGYEHTHPGGPGSDVFSWADITGLKSGQRAYLISPDSQVLVFDQSSNTITVIVPARPDPAALPGKREFLLP
jgi:hypothetical protein